MVRADRTLVGAVFVSYVLYACFMFNRAEGLVSDDGFVTLLAHLINDGLLPHRDFFVGITPGTFFVQALLQRVFGDELIVGRTYVLLQHLALFGVLWRTAVLTIPPGAGRVFSVALLFFGPLFSHPSYSRDSLLLASTTLWMTVRYVGGGSLLNLYGAAALAGLTVLFKQNIGFASAAFVAGVAAWAYHSEGRMNKVSIPAFVVALSTPLALFGLYLAVSQTTAAFVDNVFRAQVSLKGPLILSSVGAFLIPNRFGLPLIAGVVSLIAALRLTGRRRGILFLIPVVGFALAVAWAYARDGKTDRVITWLNAGVGNAVLLVPATVCGAALWQLLKQRQSNVTSRSLVLLFSFSALHLFFAAMANVTWYHLSMAFPFVYVLAGRVFHDATIGMPRAEAGAVSAIARQKRRALGAAATALVAYGAIVNLFITAFGPRPDSLWNRNPLPELYAMVNPGCPGLRGMRLPSKGATRLCSFGEYVRSRVGPDEEIFAFPQEMPLYLASQRFSTSYYTHFYWEALRPDSSHRTIQYLNVTNPRILILTPMPKGATAEQRDQILSVDGRVSELRDFIARNYVLTTVIGGFEILERSERQAQR
jgi:hypothetical protein